MKNASITITAPSDILHQAIAAAIKPHVKALAEAAARDIELDAKANAVHPDRIKAQGLTLIDRANAGDDKALAELEKHGGLDGYIQAKAGMFPIYEGACRAHAMAAVPLFEALARDLIPAMQEAGKNIQKQFTEVMGALGELSPGLSEWDASIRNRSNSIKGAIKRAEIGLGPAFLLSQLGLAEFLKD
jgi:hypothetical protein